MAGISLITNFNINAFAPIDSRMVATSSTARNNITYKYEGLKVYDQSDKKTYTWTGTTWSVEGNGIYGGSGSLVGDTVVNTGFVGNTVGSQSFQFGFSATASTANLSFRNYFQRINTLGSDQIEWKNEFLNGSTVIGYQYFGDTYIRFGFVTGERFRINNDNSVSIYNNSNFNGKISASALTSNQTYNLPPTGGTFAMVSDLLAGSQTLQSVTTIGSTTDKGIKLLGSSMSIIHDRYAGNVLGTPRTTTYFGPTAIGVSYNDYFSATAWGVSMESFDESANGNRLVFRQGTYSTYIYSDALSSPRTIRFPNASGIVRLAGDNIGWSLARSTFTDNATIPGPNRLVTLRNTTETPKTIILPTISSISTQGSIIVFSVESGQWNISTTGSNNKFFLSGSATPSSGPLPIGITRMIGSVVNVGNGWVKW